MRILSALFDVCLLPAAVAADGLNILCGEGPARGGKSVTRGKIEDIEDNLR